MLKTVSDHLNICSLFRSVSICCFCWLSVNWFCVFVWPDTFYCMKDNPFADLFVKNKTKHLKLYYFPPLMIWLLLMPEGTSNSGSPYSNFRDWEGLKLDLYRPVRFQLTSTSREKPLGSQSQSERQSQTSLSQALDSIPYLFP